MSLDIGTVIGVGGIAFLVVFGVAVVISSLRGQSTFRSEARSSWQEVAENHGLDWGEEGGFYSMNINGVYRGKAVQISIRREKGWTGIDPHDGSQRHSENIYTVIRAELDGAHFRGVSLSKHGFADKFDTLLGGEDIEIGDESFDRDFRLQGAVDDDTRRFLESPKARKAIRERISTHLHFRIDDGFIEFDKRDVMTSPKKLNAWLDRAVKDAIAIDELAAGIGLETKREDEPGDAAELSKEASQPVW